MFLATVQYKVMGRRGSTPTTPGKISSLPKPFDRADPHAPLQLHIPCGVGLLLPHYGPPQGPPGVGLWLKEP
jgi:hypothetical protein